jgi:hypothetical protein
MERCLQPPRGVTIKPYIRTQVSLFCSHKRLEFEPLPLSPHKKLHQKCTTWEQQVRVNYSKENREKVTF